MKIIEPALDYQSLKLAPKFRTYRFECTAIMLNVI